MCPARVLRKRATAQLRGCPEQGVLLGWYSNKTLRRQSSGLYMQTHGALVEAECVVSCCVVSCRVYLSLTWQKELQLRTCKQASKQAISKHSYSVTTKD